MGRFGKSAKTSSQIPTAALPDIIFILLFFFMVATKPKKTEPQVTTTLAAGTQLMAIDKDREEIDLYLGYPKNAEQYGTEPMVEIDGKLVNIGDVDIMVRQHISGLPPQKQSPGAVFVFITLDKAVKYGSLFKVKKELKDIGVRPIIYSVKKESKF